MVEACICDGDITIFHSGVTDENGIFAVSIGNTPVVKWVDRSIASRTIVLYSANPGRRSGRVRRPEAGDIRIAGRVVTCYHRV
jgi:SOS-response transcriptional repressor LexA